MIHTRTGPETWNGKDPIYIYILGPLSKGNQDENVQKAIDVFNMLTARGHIAFCPHFFLYAERRSPLPYQAWMRTDFAFMHALDTMARATGRIFEGVRIMGDSPGSDKEETAMENDFGRWVHHGIREWLDARQGCAHETGIELIDKQLSEYSCRYCGQSIYDPAGMDT